MGRVLRLYQAHAVEWDAEFARVRDRFADRLQCRRGCSMCCSQMFGISDVEAGVIAAAVAELPGPERERLRRAARDYVASAGQLGLLREESGEESVTPKTGVRLTCPALEGDACSVYEARPIICRKWGIPVWDPTKPDRLHACELNFQAGEEIAVGDLVERQTALLERWAALKDDLRTDPAAPRRAYTVAEAILMSE